MVLQLQSMNSVKGPPPDESDGEHDEHGEELHQNEAGKRNGLKVVREDESNDGLVWLGAKAGFST